MRFNAQAPSVGKPKVTMCWVPAKGLALQKWVQESLPQFVKNVTTPVPLTNIKQTKLLTRALTFLQFSTNKKHLETVWHENKLSLPSVQSDKSELLSFDLSMCDSSRAGQGWLPERDGLATRCKQERLHQCFPVVRRKWLGSPRLCLCWKTLDVLGVMRTGVYLPGFGQLCKR